MNHTFKEKTESYVRTNVDAYTTKLFKSGFKTSASCIRQSACSLLKTLVGREKAVMPACPSTVTPNVGMKTCYDIGCPLASKDTGTCDDDQCLAHPSNTGENA